MDGENPQGVLSVKSIVLWCTLFIFIRSLIIAVLYFITGGREVASDVDFHMMLITDPLAIVGGTAPQEIASYAPLQSLITWPVYSFYSLVFPAFVSIRLLMASIELACFVVFLLIVSRQNLRLAKVNTLCLCFILAPHQFLTSAVFVQDEVICLFFLLVCLLFMLSHRYIASLFAIVAGVLFGKIFLIVPLFYITVFGFSKQQRWATFWFLPPLLVGFVYGLVVFMVQLNAGSLPLVGFTPTADYSVMYWTLLLEQSTNVKGYKDASLLLTIVVQTALAVYLGYWCYIRDRSVNAAVLISLPLALFFLTFYQHNSEYTMMIAALALLAFSNVYVTVVAAFVFSFAWVPKFLFGFKNLGLINANASETRNQILESTIGQLGINFAQLHTISILIYSALFLILSIALVCKLFASANSCTDD